MKKINTNLKKELRENDHSCYSATSEVTTGKNEIEL